MAKHGPNPKSSPRPLTRDVEMNTLSRIMAKVGQHTELDSVFETALRELCSAFGLDAGCLYIFDESARELKLKAQIGVDSAFLEARKTLKFGEGCAGTALVTKEVFAPTKTETRFICKAEKDFMGQSCLAAIPILSENKVLGVLELFGPASRRITSQESELVETISKQLAIAITNASTYRDLRFALENTKKLLRATETTTATLEFRTILEYLAKLASELTRVSRTAIALYDQKTKDIELAVTPAPLVDFENRRSPAGPFLQKILEIGQTVAVYDLSDLSDDDPMPMDKESVKSILIVPLRFAGQTLGVLYLDEPNTNHVFTAFEIELAEGIARHAAGAIQNTRSLESNQRALANAEGLLQAAQMIATISDPDLLLNQLAGLAPKLIGTTGSTILLYKHTTDEIQIAVPPDRQIPKDTICKIGDDLFGMVFHQGKTIATGDLSTFPEPLRVSMLRDNVEQVLLTPMHYGAEVVGALILYDVNRRHEFTPEEMGLAEAIAYHAAIGIINARSFSEQRRIAETLQQSFIPTHPPEIPGLEFGFDYRAASEYAFVGGDFYDFLEIDDQLGVYMGDVCGHGIEATSIAAMVKSTLRAFAFEHKSTPVSIVKKTNKVVAKQILDHQFITLNYGVLDLSKRIYKYVSIGHPPPLLIHQKTRFLDVIPQVPLGMEESTSYRQQTAVLPKNSFLLLYTDGLIEARFGDQFFGLQRLLEVARDFRGSDPQALVDFILTKVEDFSGYTLADDIALLAIHVK